MTCPFGTVIPLWLPGPADSATYFQVPCNVDHDPLYRRCAYVDPRSGSVVQAGNEPGPLAVDARGCITTPKGTP